MADFYRPANFHPVNVEIEYCVPCDYSEKALAVAHELIRNYQHALSSLTLKIGSKGVFKVSFDDDVVFSKKEAGRQPKLGEILQLLKERIGDHIPIYQR